MADRTVERGGEVVLSKDPETGVVRRHHLHPDVYGENVRRAAAAGIAKRVTTHALRHSFAGRIDDAFSTHWRHDMSAVAPAKRNHHCRKRRLLPSHLILLGFFDSAELRKSAVQLRAIPFLRDIVRIVRYADSLAVDGGMRGRSPEGLRAAGSRAFDDVVADHGGRMAVVAALRARCRAPVDFAPFGSMDACPIRSWTVRMSIPLWRGCVGKERAGPAVFPGKTILCNSSCGAGRQTANIGA